MNIPDPVPIPSEFRWEEEILPVKVSPACDLSRMHVDPGSGGSSRYKTRYPRYNMPGPAY
jgi:hypothetical protein